jgi:hypothetical protein
MELEELLEEATIEEGLLKWEGKIWVPLELQLEVIQDLHRSMIAVAHRGVRITWNHAVRYYKFPGMKNKISEVIKKCDICKKIKDERHWLYGIL